MAGLFDRMVVPPCGLTFHQEIQYAIAARERLVLVVGPKAVANLDDSGPTPSVTLKPHPAPADPIPRVPRTNPHTPRRHFQLGSTNAHSSGKGAHFIGECIRELPQP